MRVRDTARGIELLELRDTSRAMRALAFAAFKFGAKPTTPYPTIGTRTASWPLQLPQGTPATLEYEIDRGSWIALGESAERAALVAFLEQTPTLSDWTPVPIGFLEDIRGIPERAWLSRVVRRWGNSGADDELPAWPGDPTDEQLSYSVPVVVSALLLGVSPSWKVLGVGVLIVSLLFAVWWTFRAPRTDTIRFRFTFFAFAIVTLVLGISVIASLARIGRLTITALLLDA